MKATVLLSVFVLAMGLSACEKIATEEPPIPTVPERTLAEKAKKYADEHPEIQSPLIVNALPKSVNVALGSVFIDTFRFGYNAQEQLVQVSTDRGPILDITLDPTARKANGRFGKQELNFQLNQNGLAESAVGAFPSGKEANNQYFYKNGYLVAIVDKLYLTTLKYSGNGDLLEWKGITHQGERVNIAYEYTDYPNTIRQEVTYWTASHLSFRGDFLGKYSSKLLKKAVISVPSLGENPFVLDFEYTFDSKGRVSRMLIKRDTLSDVLYEYRY
ncbi:DUF4595 domain-containing protein [Runella slithyformis]|uniref:DUF4292 domain-containing protein n=1 Tax=Runella slithyformis (strain ATCC 29530 / DSM 19594 / LMG 11500 / NCIMB 11436 / LSU 4) TaxID=761193 RepID=A0A7U3ZJK5_RUNSL|nr:DUF4595 domain-containing protein [Runella slithyformis]AEI48372.1 hypothetical protein Runsl_1953 [Runella slithyformis DSM 19594]